MRGLRGWLLLGAAALATAAVFTVALLVTGFLACGVSGCGGGGFGPAYAPVQAQVGLLVAGLTLLPLPLLMLRRWRGALRAVAAVATVALGSVLAMLVLGLGPDGCPWGQTQATAGPEAFHPGSRTCSADPHAVPRR